MIEKGEYIYVMYIVIVMEYKRPGVHFQCSSLVHDLPGASGSPRPAMVTCAGLMVVGCRARLVSGWRTTLVGPPWSVPEVIM